MKWKALREKILANNYFLNKIFQVIEIFWNQILVSFFAKTFTIYMFLEQKRSETKFLKSYLGYVTPLWFNRILMDNL